MKKDIKSMTAEELEKELSETEAALEEISEKINRLDEEMSKVEVYSSSEKIRKCVQEKEELEKRGYQVRVFMEGLGQNPDIQRIFIEHIRFTIAHKPIDILDKKKEYAAEKD